MGDNSRQDIEPEILDQKVHQDVLDYYSYHTYDYMAYPASN